MTSFSRRLFCSCLALALPAAAQAPPSSADALARMIEGNRQFRIDDPTRPALNQARRTALARGQSPFAAILGCADSRTPPEALFQVGLGDIFTVRVAGNSFLPGAVASLEYAVEELHVPLILVMGHERCGAVAAANQVLETGGQLPGGLSELVAPIIPAIIQARREGGADPLDAAVRLHARRTAQRLREADGVIAHAVHEGRLRVEAAYYDLDNGEVSLLPA